MPNLILSLVAPKNCIKCGECKPFTKEFFHKKLKSFVPMCIVCTHKKVLENAPKLKEKRDLRSARRKLAKAILQFALIKFPAAHPVDQVCSICGNIHPLLKEFYIFNVRRNCWTKHCRACQRAMCRSHYEQNKDSYHVRARAFEKAHPEWQSARNKKYLLENRDKVNARLRNRWLSDAVYYIERRTRVLIADTIRRKGFTKRHGAAVILGCGWEFFKSHMERQFVKGMTWENRSDWHIDHIQPLATAKTQEDVIALNHFTNLRPMWAKDNMSKSAKITHLI